MIDIERVLGGLGCQRGRDLPRIRSTLFSAIQADSSGTACLTLSDGQPPSGETPRPRNTQKEIGCRPHSVLAANDDLFTSPSPPSSLPPVASTPYIMPAAAHQVFVSHVGQSDLYHPRSRPTSSS